MAWTGTLRIYRCTSCCKRWYFTFNGAECSAPLLIDGIVYMWQGNTQDLRRVRHIEGTVTTSSKEGCAWDSGLVIVRVEHLVTPTRAGSLCPGSSLKKFLRLRPRYRGKTFLPAKKHTCQLFNRGCSSIDY